MAHIVVALYKFHSIENPSALQETLLTQCVKSDLRGTLLLAHEGINGTLCGSREGITDIVSTIRAIPGFADIEIKESTAQELPFLRIKVKVRAEVVSMRAPQAKPENGVGDYVEPEDWNDLIGRDDVRVLDVRNHFEHRVGRFEGAEDPETESFSDFPAYVKAHLDPARDRHIAMYCTGGIRCEKASAYLLDLGFDRVSQLHGGVLKYLERVDLSETKWHGECFVFDQRVSLTHGLEEGSFELCFGCRSPVSAAERDMSTFERGVSCVYCIDNLSASRREGLRERMRQVARAEAEGRAHIGDDACISSLSDRS